MIWTNQCMCGHVNNAGTIKVGMRCSFCKGYLTFNEWKTEDGRPAQMFFEQIRNRKRKSRVK
jgi:RecJ-like exonuclease